MTLPNDNEVKRAIKRLDDCEAREELLATNDEAIVVLRDLAQAYLKAGSQMPEKKEEIRHPGKKGNSRFNHHIRGFNDCREQATLAHLKSIQSYERTIAELREQIAKGED